MRPARHAPFLVAGLLALVPGACRDAPARPRLVVLYAPCTVNRDLVAPYGPAPYTPNLAAFARESAVFRRHHTETDQSGPAYASLFSGAQADRHGVFRHPARLRDDLHLAAEAFAAQGYETHFWSGHPMASAELNYGQGVKPENVHLRVPGVASLYELTANDAAFDAILARLRRDPSYRAYVQVAFTVTHSPYTPLDPRALADFRRENPREWPLLPDGEVSRLARVYDANYLRLQWDFPSVTRELGLSPSDTAHMAAVLEAYYKASLRLLDHCFGRVVARIRAEGLLEDSLVAFTADHGETLYREDALFKWTHGAEVAPEAIEVPLLVRLPGRRPRHGSYDGVSRSIDVYPTLAGLSGFSVGAAEGVDGVDLSQAVRGRASPPPLRAFSHTTLLGPELVKQFDGWLVSRYHPSVEARHMWVSAREGDAYARLRKLDDGKWGFDVFQLGGDGPLRAAALDPARRLDRELARALEGYRERLLSSHAAQGGEASLEDAEARERLRALGYVR